MDKYTTSAASIPPLAMLPKDHKPVQGPIPATRPVCLCTSSINLRPSDILSEVLAPIAREEEKYIESESTEECLYHVDEANRLVREERSSGELVEGELIVGSMDIEALYPSIEVNRSAKIVSEMVSESKVQIENVDFETAVVYIASNSSKAQVYDWGMSQYIPKRKSKTGTRPGPTTGELGKRRRFDSEGEEVERKSLWVFKRRELSDKEKAKVISKVIEIGIRTTFRNHVYQWRVNFLCSERGGPLA